MLNRIIERRIEAFERAFGYDASYMKEILGASRRAFARVARLESLAAYRDQVPRDAWYAAKIAATMHEDCGPCTQLVVDMARKEGVPAEVLRAVVTGADEALPAETRLGLRYARAVLAHDEAAEALRAEVLGRWGQRGLVSLALGMVGSRLYPALKYALGHGRSCRTIRIGDTTLPARVRPAA
jgi:hypothetical protein